MKLSAATKIDELLKRYPALESFLVRYNPKFELLKNKVARATVGKVANLKSVAKMGGVELARLLEDLAGEIRRQTGESIEVEAESPGTQEGVEGLKDVIRALHNGASVEDVKERFNAVIAGANAGQIAQMEQQLISEGLPVEEVQRLCDVHVGAFKETLDNEEEVQAPPGHPVDTYVRANVKIGELVNRLAQLGRQTLTDAGSEIFQQLAGVLEELQGIENHYTRKENQLFPFLERHGITGPSKVMWGVHDEIRATFKAMMAAVASRNGAELTEKIPKLARDIAEMIYKENKILLPMALETLSEEEWVELRRGEDALGYSFVEPAGDFGSGDSATAARTPTGGGLLNLDTGALSLEQVNLILTHLPLDLSFVDENDVVRYYSEGERHFPRSPAVIGRAVQNCHPPDSVDVVERILDAFKSGEKDTAEFWINFHGAFVHIRYFAIRDASGAYKGCLEMGQDITHIQALTGERRLLDWG